MARKVYYSNDKDLEGLKWTARVVDFGVGLMVTSAINSMHDAYVFLMERKDLLRGKVKHCCNNAFREAKIKEQYIKQNMVNEKFWLDYSDKVIDEAANDITLFRISIKQTLDNAKVADSELISFIETSHVLLNVTVEQYKSVMELSREKFGRNYTDIFKDYRLDGVLYWWRQMCDRLLKDVDVDLNNDNTHGMFDRMCKKFAEGEYIQACLEEAHRNNPDFLENEVKVSE